VFKCAETGGDLAEFEGGSALGCGQTCRVSSLI